MLLEAELVMELTVEIGPIQEVGHTREGFLRVIPITGGTDEIKSVGTMCMYRHHKR